MSRKGFQLVVVQVHIFPVISVTDRPVIKNETVFIGVIVVVIISTIIVVTIIIIVVVVIVVIVTIIVFSFVTLRVKIIRDIVRP